MILIAEYIWHQDNYRVFDPEQPQQSIAYIDDIPKDWEDLKEYATKNGYSAVYKTADIRRIK